MVETTMMRRKRLVSKRDFLSIIAFLSVFLYCVLWIWQGFDVSDEGFILTKQWLCASKSVIYYDQDLTRWLTTLIGGLWLMLTSDLGLLGARIGWALALGLTALIAFRILSKLLTEWEAYFSVVVVTLACTYHSTLIINYNVLPSLLLIVMIWALLNSQLDVKDFWKQLTWSILSGLFLGLGIMARFPLVLALIVPFIPAIIFLLVEKRTSFRLWKLAGISLISALITLALCLVYLHWIGGLHYYVRFIGEAILGGDRGNSYSTDFLLQITLKSTISAAVAAAIFSFWSFLLGFELQRSPLRDSKESLIIFSLGLFLPLVIAQYYHDSGLFPRLGVLLHYYSMILPGLYLVMLALIVLGHLHIKKNDFQDGYRITYVILGVVYAYLIFVGSGNGISNSKHGLWLAIPLTLFLLPEVIVRLTSENFGIQLSRSVMKKYVIAGMCIIAITGFSIRLRNPYRDNRNRFRLTAPMSHPKLRGIHTTYGRASSVAGLLRQLDRVVNPGDLVLAYNTIPMIHYVTETMPAMDHPWPTLMTVGLIKQKLRILENSDRRPKVVVRSVTNTRNPNWGAHAVRLAGSRDLIEKIRLIDDYLQKMGYILFWANKDFQVFTLPRS